jgi:hypothetical protein
MRTPMSEIMGECSRDHWISATSPLLFSVGEISVSFLLRLALEDFANPSNVFYF